MNIISIPFIETRLLKELKDITENLNTTTDGYKKALERIMYLEKEFEYVFTKYSESTLRSYFYQVKTMLEKLNTLEADNGT